MDFFFFFSNDKNKYNRGVRTQTCLLLSIFITRNIVHEIFVRFPYIQTRLCVKIYIDIIISNIVGFQENIISYSITYGQEFV